MESVSVIVPTFNSGLTVERCLSSIQSQSFKNWVVYVVDDCSTDNTVELVSNFVSGDSRIRLFALERNSGAGQARNFGINCSSGEWIAFCDSDDFWLPHKLETILDLGDKGSHWLHSSYKRVKGEKSTVVMAKTVGYSNLIYSNYIACSTVVLKRSILKDLRFPDLRLRQDYSLWLSLSRQGYIAQACEDVLVEYTDRNDSLSSNIFDSIKGHFRIVREYVSPPLIYFNLLVYMFNALRKRNYK